MTPKFHTKALGFSVKVDDVLRRRQNQLFPRGNCVWRRRKKLLTKPYKPYGKWIILQKLEFAKLGQENQGAQSSKVD